MVRDGKPNLVSVTSMAAGLCAIGLLGGAAAFLFSNSPNSPKAIPVRATVPVQQGAALRSTPSLHCLFSDFTHASVVVGFDFAVALAHGAPPRFAERAEAVRNDPSVDFDADHRPIWSYAVDDDGTPTISSPDGATRILLYGFKLGQGDASWLEAGIRSNTFRNLDGKCFQAHFNDGAEGGTNAAPP